jgi:type II secretory pathway pseudopilin PulG
VVDGAHAHCTGFTVVEVVSVIAVVLLLAGVLVPVVTTQMADAKSTRAAAEMETIARAFTTFRTHTASWPGYSAPVKASDVRSGYEDLTEFCCLYSNEAKLPGWRGPYLNQGLSEATGNMRVAAMASNRAAAKGLLDPWGQPYRIYYAAASAGGGGSIAILCRGPDGTFNSSASDVDAGKPAGDDLLKVVARRL